jgi:hypothetical protein
LQLIGEPTKHRWLAERDLGRDDAPEHDEDGRRETEDKRISFAENKPNSEHDNAHETNRK